MLSTAEHDYSRVNVQSDKKILLDMINSLKTQVSCMEKEIAYLHDEIKELFFKGINRFEKN